MNRVATQALIFDMDGTIIPSIPYHARSWVVFCERHGLALELDELMQRTNGRNGVECMRELFGQDLSDADGWQLIHEKEAIYRELYAPVFAEVRGFRNFAQGASARGLKIGVGTAGDKNNIEFVFSNLGMDPRPPVIVGGDEGLPGKPAPAIFLEVARRLGAAPEHCIVFEDAPFGIEAARRAGMRAIGVCTTHPPEELSGPHVVAHIRDFDQLIQDQFLETLDA